MKANLIQRLNQESTWRGLVQVLMAVGIGLSPDQMEAIVVAGLTIIGLINSTKND